MTSKRYSARSSPFLLVSVTLASALLAACAPVKPWQRGHLAQPVMALDEDVMLTAISLHIYESKEASSGGVGASGGGCGCN